MNDPYGLKPYKEKEPEAETLERLLLAWLYLVFIILIVVFAYVEPLE